VDQKVAFDGKAGTAFTWQVGEREFRLDVRRGADTRSFVFNGRVFYVCGKLDKAQIDYVKSLGVDDGALMANLTAGACQDVSTDFLTRFFLSPYAAVGEVDINGGFAASLIVAPPETTRDGTAQTIQGVRCAGFNRSYKLDAKGEGHAGDEVVSEKGCDAPAIRWRMVLARELGMALMRQPGGRSGYKALDSDVKTLPGMMLSLSGKVTGHGPNGKAFARSFDVATTAVQEKTPAPEELGLPASFQVIDTKTLVAAHRANPAGAGKAKIVEHEMTVQDVLRTLILGLNPAAGLLPH
jgi:hypothetical protein